MYVLIYWDGDRYDGGPVFMDFENKSDLINFINERDVGGAVMKIYNVRKELKVEPFEKITSYKLLEK